MRRIGGCIRALLRAVAELLDEVRFQSTDASERDALRVVCLCNDDEHKRALRVVVDRAHLPVRDRQPRVLVNSIRIAQYTQYNGVKLLRRSRTFGMPGVGCQDDPIEGAADRKIFDALLVGRRPRAGATERGHPRMRTVSPDSEQAASWRERRGCPEERRAAPSQKGETTGCLVDYNN